MEQAGLMWGAFLILVLVLLVLDLGVLHRKEKEIDVKESLILSSFYISVSLLFGAWLWYMLGAERGKEFFTGYLVEKSLSMDNIFVMSLIFTYFHIPRKYQHRVLFWGIVGVITMRGLMIGIGAALVKEFEWVLMLFAAFLVFSGVKMLLMKDNPPDISDNKLLKLLKKNMRITDELHGRNFSVKLPDAQGKMVRFFTPLFVALIMIEGVDLIFALDSIPAIFAITTDPYIVYTSNIFAVLGLRALYFALSAFIERFHYLKYALALILVFIGGKVIIAELLHLEKIPASISLGVTLALLLGGVLVSLIKTKKESPHG